MKEKFTVIDKLAIALIVLFSFYYLEPFFAWKTFMGGRFRSLLGIIPFRTLFGVGIVLVWVCFYAKRGAKKGKIKLSVFAIFVSLFTVGLAGGTENNQIFSLTWLPYFVVAVYLLFPDKIQKQSYRIFVLIFAVTLVLPIIWYLLTHVGIRVPYVVLESYEEIKVIRGKYYKLYPLATQITSRWDPAFQELHLCGIYDEAGRVGTVAGLILTSEKLRLRGNWKNIIICIGGVLAFSLAFYVIVAIYYVISCFDKKKYKNIAIIILAIIIYFVFINIQFKDPNVAKFQERFVITSEGLSGDNRTNEQYDALMDDFYRSGIYNVLFGKGLDSMGKIMDARNIDGSSYKSMIYDFGVLGFGLSLLWLVIYSLFMASRKGANKIHIFAILIVYLANMYQRPSIFYMGYLLIMLGSTLIASQEKATNLKIEKQKKQRRFNCVKCSSTSGNI